MGWAQGQVPGGLHLAACPAASPRGCYLSREQASWDEEQEGGRDGPAKFFENRFQEKSCWTSREQDAGPSQLCQRRAPVGASQAARCNELVTRASAWRPAPGARCMGWAQGQVPGGLHLAACPAASPRGCYLSQEQTSWYAGQEGAGGRARDRPANFCEDWFPKKSCWTGRGQEAERLGRGVAELPKSKASPWRREAGAGCHELDPREQEPGGLYLTSCPAAASLNSERSGTRGRDVAGTVPPNFVKNVSRKKLRDRPGARGRAEAARPSS